MDIALAVSGFGIVMVLAFMVSVRSVGREQPRSWPVLARAHLPYANLSDDELKLISTREDFARALITSAERQWAPKHGAHASGRLREVLVNDIQRNAKEVLTLAEIEEFAGTAQHVILDDWARAAEGRETEKVF